MLRVVGVHTLAPEIVSEKGSGGCLRGINIRILDDRWHIIVHKLAVKAVTIHPRGYRKSEESTQDIPPVYKFPQANRHVARSRRCQASVQSQQDRYLYEHAACVIKRTRDFSPSVASAPQFRPAVTATDRELGTRQRVFSITSAVA
jgi:hypothetical protein